MIRDITIGQYYSADSVIHRLDPRTKLIGTFCFIVILFLIKGVYGLLIAGLLLFLIVKATKIPLWYIVRGQKSIYILLMFTVVLNMLMVKGDVLVKSNHVAMYIGGGKMAEASGGTWSAGSIAVKKMSKSRYNGFSYVMRYTGY